MSDSAKKRYRSGSEHVSETPNNVTTTQASDSDAKPLEKKSKQISDTVVLPVVHSTDNFDTLIRNAFDLNRAIARTRIHGNSIGYSVTRYESQKPLGHKHRDVVNKLRAIYDDSPLPFKIGKFDKPFHLRISRPGCEYDESIVPTDSSYASKPLLQKWYEHAAISGYGDVQSLETKVDSEVRDAREIPASEFTVDPELLDRIRVTWTENKFIPGNVRAEPYKIHLYGPNGHFKSHRDTPESGLVGTFLVGLGDTGYSYRGGDSGGNFCIGGKYPVAHPCSWVAFHPDVPHSISELNDGCYRAVIAFKVFQDGAPIEHEAALREMELQQRMSDVLESITVPYGILFDHKYYMGISNLNGFDAILLSAAKQQKQRDVHILPVLITSQSEIYQDTGHDEGYEDTFNTQVRPFTQTHVDLILSGSDDKKAKEQVKWLEGVKRVPFYSRDFSGSAATWKEDSDEINFTGNESDGTRENSIYLSHALLVLPSELDVNK